MKEEELKNKEEDKIKQKLMKEREDSIRIAINLQLLFFNITALHGKPCVVLLEIKEDDIIKLLAVASSTAEMKLVVDEKAAQDYVG